MQQQICYFVSWSSFAPNARRFIFLLRVLDHNGKVSTLVLCFCMLNARFFDDFLFLFFCSRYFCCYCLRALFTVSSVYNKTKLEKYFWDTIKFIAVYRFFHTISIIFVFRFFFFCFLFCYFARYFSANFSSSSFPTVSLFSRCCFAIVAVCVFVHSAWLFLLEMRCVPQCWYNSDFSFQIYPRYSFPAANKITHN